MGAKRPSSIVRQLEIALRAAPVGPEDVAAIALAKRYASVLDDLDLDPEASLIKFGPLLLGTLVELRLTPKARAAVVRGGVPGDSPTQSALDQLRARRDRRANGTPPVDAAPS